MNILILNTLYYPHKIGGAEKSVQLLAEDLSKINHNVFVVTLTNKPSYNDVINGVKIYYLNFRNIYWPYDIEKSHSSLKKIVWHIFDTYLNLQKKEIEQIIINEKPDVVHINNITGFSTQILKTLKKFNLPCVQTLRDYHYLCIKNTCYNNSNCISLCKDCRITSTFKINLLNKYVDHIVGISDFIISKHQRHGLRKNITTTKIYNAVNSIQVNTDKMSSLIDKPVRFGYIGSITQAKGVEDMLNKMSNHRLKRFQFEIKLAGNGNTSYVSFLQNKYSNLKLRFLGYQEPSLFYKSIDALIVPSLWHEPFGRVVIEGAQHQLPVFVSNNGALFELRNKIKGVKSFNLKNIKQFLNTPYGIIYNYNLDEFSSKKISQYYENLFFKMLDNEN